MRKLKDFIERKCEERYQRQLDRWNLKETNLMKDCGEHPDPDAWLFDIEWNERKQKYVLGKKAFEKGLNKSEEQIHKEN